MSATTFRNLLETSDVNGLMRYWAEAMPHLPQPKDRHQAEAMMHRARTEAISIGFDKRAYSHQWLTERNLPSGLPENLKPKAERRYPVVKEAVGLIVGYSKPFMKPAQDLVRGAMETVILDAYADGEKDHVKIKARILEAKDKEEMALFGALAKRVVSN